MTRPSDNVCQSKVTMAPHSTDLDEELQDTASTTQVTQTFKCLDSKKCSELIKPSSQAILCKNMPNMSEILFGTTINKIP